MASGGIKMYEILIMVPTMDELFQIAEKYHYELILSFMIVLIAYQMYAHRGLSAELHKVKQELQHNVKYKVDTQEYLNCIVTIINENFQNIGNYVNDKIDMDISELREHIKTVELNKKELEIDQNIANLRTQIDALNIADFNEKIKKETAEQSATIKKIIAQIKNIKLNMELQPNIIKDIDAIKKNINEIKTEVDDFDPWKPIENVLNSMLKHSGSNNGVQNLNAISYNGLATLIKSVKKDCF